MEKFTRHEGVAAHLPRSNVDTDAIIPSREMKRVSKAGLGEGLFAGWRYLSHGGRDNNPEFVLNQPGYEGSSILLSGHNFGCGSSREHAVWALKEFGFRAIIAPGFGAIFAGNCVNNGVLPLVMGEEQITEIANWVAVAPAHNRLLIDLPAQRVEASGWVYPFEIEQGAKRMLVEGLDTIALTQTRWEAIEAFHKQRQQLRPWLY
jgi:3-isopropylmalate/(R)-2-methylmalate dehydratase small subunit